jgi:hypothetical protein
VLGEFVPELGANLVVALALVTIRRREACKVRHCLDVPDQDVRHLVAFCDSSSIHLAKQHIQAMHYGSRLSELGNFPNLPHLRDRLAQLVLDFEFGDYSASPAWSDKSPSRKASCPSR